MAERDDRPGRGARVGSPLSEGWSLLLLLRGSGKTQTASAVSVEVEQAGELSDGVPGRAVARVNSCMQGVPPKWRV